VSPPEPLEESLRTLLSSLGLPEPGVFEIIRDEWADLAPPPWAGRSEPAYLRRGELVVTVPNSSLVALLRYASGDLLRRLESRIGSGVVLSVRAVTGR
jgi:hypothetical protein